MGDSAAFPVRNVRFAMNDEVPRHWHGGHIAITSFFNNLSTFFPSGERFFVAAVNHYKERISDEKLRAEIKAFCGQEGFHSREHVRYNKMLDAQGYGGEALEDRVDRLLRFITRVTTPRMRLAATCALEHFTATLAHAVLSDRRLLEDAHPVMAALWRWHAAEENEHKAVAYDVYEQVGGHYSERVVVMLVATAIFWAMVTEQQLRLMKIDKVLFSPRQWWSLFKFLWMKPGAMRGMWIHYVDYFRPGFHPWQLDNRDLLEAWKREYATSTTYKEVA
jgi:predicted metal-dependent hydrolase